MKGVSFDRDLLWSKSFLFCLCLLFAVAASVLASRSLAEESVSEEVLAKQQRDEKLQRRQDQLIEKRAQITQILKGGRDVIMIRGKLGKLTDKENAGSLFAEYKDVFLLDGTETFTFHSEGRYIQRVNGIRRSGYVFVDVDANGDVIFIGAPAYAYNAQPPEEAVVVSERRALQLAELEIGWEFERADVVFSLSEGPELTYRVAPDEAKYDWLLFWEIRGTTDAGQYVTVFVNASTEDVKVIVPGPTCSLSLGFEGLWAGWD